MVKGKPCSVPHCKEPFEDAKFVRKTDFGKNLARAARTTVVEGDNAPYHSVLPNVIEEFTGKTLLGDLGRVAFATVGGANAPCPSVLPTHKEQYIRKTLLGNLGRAAFATGGGSDVACVDVRRAQKAK